MVGPSARYASPRARLRRNPRCAVAREFSSMVWYAVDESTDSPIPRQTCANAGSSRSVRRWQSVTKLRREIATGSPSCRAGGAERGGWGGDGGRRAGGEGSAPRAGGGAVVLPPALGRQPVVAPADRVEDLFAPHALEPGDHVGVRERADVTDVQCATDRQRGSVDREYVVPRLGPVKLVLHAPLPTGATISPRCRQAKACPAPGWLAACPRRWGGSRCSCPPG